MLTNLGSPYKRIFYINRSVVELKYSIYIKITVGNQINKIVHFYHGIKSKTRNKRFLTRKEKMKINYKLFINYL